MRHHAITLAVAATSAGACFADHELIGVVESQTAAPGETLIVVVNRMLPEEALRVRIDSKDLLRVNEDGLGYAETGPAGWASMSISGGVHSVELLDRSGAVRLATQALYVAPPSAQAASWQPFWLMAYGGRDHPEYCDVDPIAHGSDDDPGRFTLHNTLDEAVDVESCFDLDGARKCGDPVPVAANERFTSYLRVPPVSPGGDLVQRLFVRFPSAPESSRALVATFTRELACALTVAVVSGAKDLPERGRVPTVDSNCMSLGERVPLVTR